MIPVIAIDGPSGSGKGTISQMLARRLGWHFLDSGALYRVLGVAARRHGLDDSAPDQLAKLAQDLDVVFDGSKVILDGTEITDEIRTESAGNMASKVAAIPAVRGALLDRQRGFALEPGLVADGRDMGTVVFPQAEAKIFLTASAERPPEAQGPSPTSVEATTPTSCAPPSRAWSTTSISRSARRFALPA